MASDKQPDVTFTGTSALEINKIRPVSYTGPLMPRGAVDTQQAILVPDISRYIQSYMDSIFKKTKEEPVVEGKTGILEKTGMPDVSKKDRVRELPMKQDPYKRLFYDQCILEGCDPETCYKKYVDELS
jgi:hypothetical protein